MYTHHNHLSFFQYSHVHPYFNTHFHIVLIHDTSQLSSAGFSSKDLLKEFALHSVVIPRGESDAQAPQWFREANQMHKHLKIIPRNVVWVSLAPYVWKKCGINCSNWNKSSVQYLNFLTCIHTTIICLFFNIAMCILTLTPTSTLCSFMTQVSYRLQDFQARTCWKSLFCIQLSLREVNQMHKHLKIIPRDESDAQAPQNHSEKCCMSFPGTLCMKKNVWY